MEKLTLNLPTMYGDHHVVEVRRILLETPGISEVYASSCFQVVEVDYDPAQLDTKTIRDKLIDAGYSDELAVPTETGVAAYGQENGDNSAFFRHTAAHKQTDKLISFSQQIGDAGRPLWPCPGMGVIERVLEED